MTVESKAAENRGERKKCVGREVFIPCLSCFMLDPEDGNKRALADSFLSFLLLLFSLD